MKATCSALALVQKRRDKKEEKMIRIKLNHESHEQRIGGWCNVNQKGQRGPTSHLFTLRQRTRKAKSLEKYTNQCHKGTKTARKDETKVA